MAKIETALDMGARPIPQAGIRVVSQDTGAVGQGMQAIGQGMGRAAVALEQRQKEDALSEAQRAAAELNDYTTDLLFNPEKGYLNQKGENAIAQGEIVGQAAMQRLAQIRGRIKNPIALQSFDTASRSTIAQANEIAMKHHAAERASYNASVNKAYVESNMNTAVVAWNGELPSILTNLNAGIDAIRAQGVADGEPLESVSNKIALFESKTLGAAIKRQAITDPMAAQRQLEKYGDRLLAEDRVALESAMQPLVENEMATEIARRLESVVGAVPVGADQNIRAILRREGGYVSNDGGAGPTNLGINSAANPDIDVSNLTQEQAVALYKERYWIPLGADKLPPEVATIAFDAAVNQGLGYAKEMLAETGGDPAKMLAHREARYRNTAKMPGKEQYLNGWLNRLNEFRGSTGVASPAGAVTNEQLLQMSNGNQRVAAGVRKMMNENTRAQNEARKAAETEATNAAWQFEAANMDDPARWSTPEGRQVLQALYQAKPELAAKFMGQDVETDWSVYSRIYSEQANGNYQTNPLDYAGSLNASQLQELLKRQADLQADPKQAAQALSVEEAIKNVQPIVLKDLKDTTPAGAKRLEMFRGAVMQQVRLLEETENDGKRANAQQVQRAVYAAMRPVTTTEVWDRDVMAFEVPFGTDPATVMPYGIGKDIVNSTFAMQEDVNRAYHANQWLDMAGRGAKAWLPENFAPVADKVTLFFKDANSNAVQPVSFGDLVAKAEKDLIERGIMPDQASVATYLSRAFSKGFVTVRGEQ